VAVAIVGGQRGGGSPPCSGRAPSRPRAGSAAPGDGVEHGGRGVGAATSRGVGVERLAVDQARPVRANASARGRAHAVGVAGDGDDAQPGGAGARRSRPR
jgi:hypothetical protein